ncbi:MAG: hypothetical protein CMP23_13275 [Rickettsiales bacterium]|nr:hypothetical protein [Rickettsiales bacterium]
MQRARLSLLAQPGLGEPGAGPLAADQVLVRGEDRRAVVALADRLEQQVLSSRVLPAAMELLGLAHLLLGDEYAARSAFEQLQARGTQAQCHRAQLSLGVLAIRNSLRQPSPEDRRFALQHALSYFAPLAAQLQTPLLADALFNQAVTLTLLGRTESARGVTKRLAELEGGSLRQARLREWVATGAAVSLLLPSEGLPTIDGDVPR